MTKAADISELFSAEDYREAVEHMIMLMYQHVPTEINRMTVSEWAEKKRVIPEGLSPYPGPYSFDVCPYMREIVDCLSDTSPVREVAVMKGTQIMFTVGAIENWIGYTIDSSPGPMLYVTGDAAMAETQMELRIDAMINGAGLGDKIAKQHRRKNQRATGDTVSRKEFPGGFLVGAGPRSGSKLRSVSFQKINVDELDAFPDATGKEGDPIFLIRRRADAYSESSKILWGSTPLFEHNSKILPLFHQGDQRRLFVPCWHCGHMQYLKWSQLRFDATDDDRLVCKMDKDGQIIESSVRYVCERCEAEWTNAHKDYFLPLGEWRPTAQPRRPGMRSYHIPGLYSPVGFRTWENAVVEFLQIKSENFPKLKYQNFVNTFLGEPFVDEGEKPRIEAVVTRERRYHRGELPEDARPSFVTIGADVQADRVECEIIAWGRDKESWSIDYLVFHGATDDLDAECWTQLRAIIGSEYYGMRPMLSGVDAGYRTDTVYDFCDTFDAGVHPVMGQEQIGHGKEYIKVYSVGARSKPRIDVNTDLLKQEFYRYLSHGPYESGELPKGYCHFPIEYKREHFNRLTAESRVLVNTSGQKKYAWDAGSRRNEQLDCRVYGLAMVYAYRAYLEEETGIEDLSWSDFWDLVDPETGRYGKNQA
jgi:phage terminase large subunit GpA-like protein